MSATPTATGPEYGFGLYIHWPYCTRICPYCDFNVYAAKTRDTTDLLDAMVKDLRAYKTELPDHPPLTSIFFGGGTPSLMTSADIGRLIEESSAMFGLIPTAEISLEANPNDISVQTLKDWKSVGINRLSLGIQSLRDDALTFLGRDHSRAEAIRAIETAQTVFPNHSLDFIYARPGQTEAEWTEELSEILTFQAPHLSLYELTIETRTAFGQRAARGELIPMDDDRQADLYELTTRQCEEAGLRNYEISNVASDPIYQSQHNMTYWQSGDWIGLGPGAHGRLTIDGTRYAIEAAKRPADYIAQSGASGRALQPLSKLETLRELVAMGLRPSVGLRRHQIDALSDLSLSETALADLQTQGLLIVTPETISLSPAGRLMADRITLELTP